MRVERTILLVLLAAAMSFGPPPAAAEEGLRAFGALVEGTWVGEGTRHVFEWGVGQRAVRSRTYWHTDEEWKLVGEGMWFWDAEIERVRGVAVAIGMPVNLFEYRSEVEGDQVVHALDAQGSAGGRFVERWSFAGDEYRWSLETESGGERLMGGTYRRADVPPEDR